MTTPESQARTIKDYLGIARRRAWIVISIALLTVASVATYNYMKEPVFRSEMKIVVGQGEGVFQPQLGNVVEPFTQTMSDLLRSEVVAQSVIADLDLSLSSTELLSNLEIVTRPSTAVLTVFYDDTDRDRGVQILDQVGTVFTELVDDRLATSDVENQDLQVSATIFDPAHSLPGQVEPKPLLNLVVGTALGLLLGLLLAFVREQLDDRIRGILDAESAFGEPAAATLPPNFVGNRPLGTSEGKKLDPVMAELSVQRVRTGVLWSDRPNQNTAVLITSGNPQEGKSTLAANLAVSIAKEGNDVVVVDADLRRPSLHGFLDVEVGPNTIGFDRIVRAQASIDDALVDVPIGTGDERRPPGRLRAILASTDSSSPTEISVSRAIELIEELLVYGNVIFDAPPLLVTTDAYALAAAADRVVALVRKGRSTRAATQELARSLRRLRARAENKGDLVVVEVEPRFDPGQYALVRSG